MTMTYYPVKWHGLTQRAESCLKNAGLTGKLTPQKVLLMFPNLDQDGGDLLKLKNLGIKTLHEIRAWIKTSGIVIQNERVCPRCHGTGCVPRRVR
jgi:ribosomal protein S27AE